MKLHLLDDAGQPLDAHLEFAGGDLVYHSRSGKRGQPAARNLDYGRALRLLLTRVRYRGYRLRHVWLDSDEVLHLPLDQRVVLGGADLATSPDEQFRILSRAMQVFGRAEDAVYGGSRVKRIRLAGDWAGDTATARAALGIGGGVDGEGDVGGMAVTGASGRPANADQDETEGAPVFDPSSVEDGRKLIAMMIKRRQGQTGFRRSLMAAYGGRCAVSGCAIAPLLEAAHIHPYRGPETNAVQNGLLLRADIHTLFDLGLVTVSDRLEVQISVTLRETDYGAFHGRALAIPSLPYEGPSELALAWHRDAMRR